MAGHDFDVQVAIGDGLANLLPGPAGRENGEGAGKGDFAAHRQARGGPHHILLGDADVEKPVFKDLAEHMCLGRAGQVRIQNDDVRVFLSQTGQDLAILNPGALFGDSFHDAMVPYAANSFRACSYSSLVGATP